MSRVISFPDLSGKQLVELQRLLRARSTPGGLQRRAQLIWQLAAGASLAEASEWVGLHYTNSHLWMKRFLRLGLAGLGDRPKSGRPRVYGEEVTTEILKIAAARPKDLGLRFATWSLPKLEEYARKQLGRQDLTRSTIRRRLREAGLRFLSGRSWCKSSDPDFEVKKTMS